ncbi:MAG TPA: ABC transporter ATP-binding protein [Acidimicrobiales bacterium]|nr:ABC transporter ATP-binding protein [Acidimicrobiales bacterium]
MQPDTEPPVDGQDRTTVPTTAASAIPLSTTPPLRDLWRYARGHRPQAVFAFVMSVCNKVFDIAPELLIGAAVDLVVKQNGRSFVGRVIGSDDRFTQLTVLVVVTVAIWLLESLTEYLAVTNWRNLAQSIEHDARMDTYRHVQTLEMAYFEDRTSGGLMTVLNDDVNQLERFLDMGPHKLVITAANVVFLGVTFLVVSPLLALLAFVPIPVIVAGSLWYQKRLEPRYARVRRAAGAISDALTNGIGGIATIKAFNAEVREVARVRADSDDYRLANADAITYSTAFRPLIRTAVLAGFTMTLVIGGRAALRGDLAVGLFSMLVYMTQRLLWPLTDLGETFDLYQRAMASCRRIFGLLQAEPRILPGAHDLPAPVRGAVRFENVSFAYSPASGDVLQGFDLDAGAGETHAIVGATGSGKSTVVKLLLRLYEPTSGRITVDGEAIDRLTFRSLRGATGFVAQDVFLFYGTIRENLTYGRPDATDAEIRQAARLAEADTFIESLPDGYDTMVGERGQKLSGGQRQRLTIARAILRDPAILMLDEATSAVDNETEAAIQRSLAKVSAGRTTIVIAHRLSTVRHAHRIHVMEAGRVIEAGTHDELVARGGLYAALWRVQTGEAIPTADATLADPDDPDDPGGPGGPDDPDLPIRAQVAK